MTTNPAASVTLFNAYFLAHPDEVTQALENASPADAVALLDRLAPERGVVLVERLMPSFAAEIISRLPDQRVVELLAAMDPGHAASVLGQLDRADRDRLLGLLAEQEAAELRDLLSYPPDSAGAIMETRVRTFRPDQTVRQALAQLRRVGAASPALLVAEQGKLRGLVPLTRAVVASPHAPLVELISDEPLHALGTAPREDVVALLRTADVPVIPVVDPTMRLLGQIDQSALVRAIQEEATADLQTLVGVGKEERALSNPWLAVRKRLPWLNVNLATAFLAAAVVGLFEDVIARFTALAVLLPVVAGQSGNSGAQALAVTMRGLALREIRVRHGARVLAKESVAGLINGAAIAVVTCLGVYFWSGSLGLCAVIGLSMVIAMLLAGLAGAAIPLILASLRQDPAQSGSIILTTVTDVAGFFTFLGLASLFSALL